MIAPHVSNCQSGWPPSIKEVLSEDRLPVIDRQPGSSPEPAVRGTWKHLSDPHGHHPTGCQYLARIDELKGRADRSGANRQPNSPAGGHPPRMAAFFLVFFVFGQATSYWALFSGHLAALACGLVFSFVGFVVGISLLVGQFLCQRRGIRQLHPQASTSPGTGRTTAARATA